MQSLSPLDGTSCVAMNAASGQWQSYHCGTQLPYVCKKPFDEASSLPGRTACMFVSVCQYVSNVHLCSLFLPSQAFIGISAKTLHGSFEYFSRAESNSLSSVSRWSITNSFHFSQLSHSHIKHFPAQSCPFHHVFLHSLCFFSCAAGSLELAVAHQSFSSLH